MTAIRILHPRQATYRRQVDRLLQRQDPAAPQVEATVREVLEAVRREGDRAVIRYTAQWDGVRLTPDRFALSRRETLEAYAAVKEDLVDALKLAARRIAAFHERQRSNPWLIPEGEGGGYLGQWVLPLENVGIYVPGGKAAYPSSVLMNAIPARVAGVQRIVMCTPAPAGKIDPTLVVAAQLAGVETIFRIGGAQAIAALAYGTETIPKVDKVVGPGNRYVAEAKRQVYGAVGVDLVAGPSEVLVVADDSARPEWLAADLLAQAEHDEAATALLITPSERLARRVQREVTRQLARLPRRAIVTQALRARGGIVVVRDLYRAVLLANAFAPEHLELAVERPFDLLGLVRHAGAVFLGHYCPEAVGDYMAGPNHVLPTGGTARFSSPLGVEDFLKRMSILAFSERDLHRLGETVIRLAEAEGLQAHAESVRVRMMKSGVRSQKSGAKGADKKARIGRRAP